ncbi:MAG: DUF4339 domain-containing protein [Candidatus Amulumruptor caecigallinarius]|nr:DUF4339 domain-containing protein [Candidatus Amulumruptor caecigallinarius]
MYYLYLNGRSVGPMSAAQVGAYDINPNTQVSRDGAPWQPLMNFPELMEVLSNKRTASGSSDDSKRVLAGIMAILFGTLGIQYFICNKVSGGLITILLSIVTCGGWGLLTFIQGIMMLCMSDEEFNAKYVYTDKTLPLF